MPDPILDATNPSAVAVPGAPSSITEIENGILMDDVDANGMTIAVLGGLEVGYITKQEICVGIRTSGKVGSGSWDDPLHVADTVTLESIVSAHMTAKGIDVPIVRMREGEYLTNGDYGFHWSTQRALIGSGRRATFLKLNPAIGPTINTGISVVGNDSLAPGDGMVFEDFTADCGYAELQSPSATPFKINGIGVYGDNVLVRNVGVINGYGQIDGLVEHFGIIVLGDHPTIDGCTRKISWGLRGWHCQLRSWRHRQHRLNYHWMQGNGLLVERWC